MPLSQEQAGDLISDLHMMPEQDERMQLVRAFLDASGVDTEEEIDLTDFSPLLSMCLFHIVHGRPFHVSKKGVETLRGEHVFRYLQRQRQELTRSERADICWVKSHLTSWMATSETTQSPSSGLQQLLRHHREKGHLLSSFPPVAIAPSCHYGRECGKGAFSLIHILEGQLIHQFTGKVVSPSKSYLHTQDRMDYVLNARYGGVSFLVDPLAGRQPDLQHRSAYINEPSSPPFPVGSNARHLPTGRNVLVKKYDHANGRMAIEFADASMRYVPPEEIDASLDHRHAHQVKYRANCSWHDFPVSLNLYRFERTQGDDGGRKGGGGGMYLFRKKEGGDSSCRCWYTQADVLRMFDHYADVQGVYNLTPTRMKRVVRGCILVLKKGIFPGMHSETVVTSVDRKGDRVHVVHFVRGDTWWSLPEWVMGAKLSTCASCKQKDDGDCQRCRRVAFPVIYACERIRPGDELLCLYREQTQSTRGIGCPHRIMKRLPHPFDACTRASAPPSIRPLSARSPSPPPARPPSPSPSPRQQPAWLPANYRIVVPSSSSPSPPPPLSTPRRPSWLPSNYKIVDRTSK